jgi:hypothetical protein
MSQRKYEQATEATTDCVVIYQPPTWDGHREAMEDRNPRRALGICYWEHVKSGAYDRALCEALGIDVGRVVNEDKMRRDLNMRTDQFRSLRRAIFVREQWHQVMKIVLRIKPQTEGPELEMYKYLEFAPIVDGARVVLDDELKHAVKFWKTILRLMNRHGYVSIKENCTVYYLGGEPDWDKLERKREKAEAELETMIRQTEAMGAL